MKPEHIRKQVQLEGQIQGVGFRPFVFKLALELDIKGWAANTIEGIILDLEGEASLVELMIARLQQESPLHSLIESIQVTHLKPADYTGFEILKSIVDGKPSVYVPTDIATCPACLEECNNPNNRRFRYPFISCSHCGPRFSIIESLPFDRERTTMKYFPMCASCQAEYDDPNDLRFHAQTIACWQCGPRLELWDVNGKAIADQYEAIDHAVAALKSGATVALKGIGGYQLLVDASNHKAIMRLRDAKARPDKPFAVMFKDIDTVSKVCYLTAFEQQLLCSPAAPIVILKRISLNESVSNNVAPANTNLGVMLPYSPLHHILMTKMQSPVVATSGNRGDEPICIDEKTALSKLQGLADYFLVHNRAIIRPLDDSIVYELYQRETVLRRARGYTPLPIKTIESRHSILALGGHHKNTIALSKDNHIVLSQYIGNLNTLESVSGFQNTIEDLCQLYHVQPDRVVNDKHPDYYSSQYAQSLVIDKHTVQHHYAHALACMAEHQLSSPALAVVWDGSGYGDDGIIWGGEFLLIEQQGFSHQAAFLPFSLPGGSAAIKEPRRTALGLLYEIYGDRVFTQKDWPLLSVFTEQELIILEKMLTQQINTPKCSSVGRLFDGLASLLGLCQVTSFDGQAALHVEQALTEEHAVEPYDLPLIEISGQVDRIDWKPMFLAIIEDIKQRVDGTIIVQKFHFTLAEIIVYIARRVGRNCVILSGGCFQNRYLTEQVIDRLQQAGFQAYWHQKIPPNDGGLAVGQLWAAIQETG